MTLCPLGAALARKRCSACHVASVQIRKSSGTSCGAHPQRVALLHLRQSCLGRREDLQNAHLSSPTNFSFVLRRTTAQVLNSCVGVMPRSGTSDGSVSLSLSLSHEPSTKKNREKSNSRWERLEASAQHCLRQKSPSVKPNTSKHCTNPGPQRTQVRVRLRRQQQAFQMNPQSHGSMRAALRIRRLGRRQFANNLVPSPPSLPCVSMTSDPTAAPHLFVFPSSPDPAATPGFDALTD